MWLIAFASSLSAVWILIANAWMQHPIGYTIRDGRAELVDFPAVIFQKFAIMEFFHTISGAYILSAFSCHGGQRLSSVKKTACGLFYPVL